MQYSYNFCFLILTVLFCLKQNKTRVWNKMVNDLKVVSLPIAIMLTSLSTSALLLFLITNWLIYTVIQYLSLYFQ